MDLADLSLFILCLSEMFPSEGFATLYYSIINSSTQFIAISKCFYADEVPHFVGMCTRTKAIASNKSWFN